MSVPCATHKPTQSGRTTGVSRAVGHYRGDVPEAQRDLATAATIIEGVANMLRRATMHLAESGGPEQQQVLAYDLAHSSAALETARSLIDYGNKGEVEATITCAFVADMVHDFATRLLVREAMWSVQLSELASFNEFEIGRAHV